MVYLLKMVIFHSYVSLPEGKSSHKIHRIGSQQVFWASSGQVRQQLEDAQRENEALRRAEDMSDMTVLENRARKIPRGNLWKHRNMNPNIGDLARKTLDLAWDTIIQSEPFFGEYWIMVG